MSTLPKQLSLFSDGTDSESRIVNIASVPQLSPFRYPGGKTWLIPTIRQWLRSLPYQPITLLEPFVGGGSVSLTAVAEQLIHHAVMVELDDDIASVWQTIVNDGEIKWLVDEITAFRLNSETAKLELKKSPVNTRERAFQTILRNRVNRGGIIAPGSGLIKAGENGKGITSRWYPQTLKKRILTIANLRAHLTFVHGDGFEVLLRNIQRPDWVFFIDPPYTASKNGAGKRLYKHFVVDHKRLFELASQVQGSFLMTYENSDEVNALAQEYHFEVHPIAMKNTHNSRKVELLISKNLDWLR